MTENPIDPARTLIIVCGASKWPQLEQFQPSAAFRNTAEQLRGYFASAEGMGLPSGNLLWLFDDPGNAISQLDEMNKFLRKRFQALKSPTGRNVAVFLVYVGHGALEDQAYCLMIRDSHDPNRASTSLRVADLATMLRRSAPESLRIVILDSCFAGAAVKEFQSDVGQIEGQKVEEALTDAGIRGVAVLCAANARNPTRLNLSAQCTMFGYALVEVLKRGDATEPGPLNLHQVSRLTRRELEQFDNAPRPEVHSPDQHDGDAAHMPIFPNPAHPYVDQTRGRTWESRRRRRLMRGAVVSAIVAIIAVTATIVFATRDRPPTETGPARHLSAMVAGGRQPTKIAIDSQRHVGYVADKGGDTVAVLDTSANKFVDFIHVGKAPIGVAIDETHHTAYVADSGDNSISVFDTVTRQTLEPIAVEEQASKLAVDGPKQLLYVATGVDIAVVDLKTRTTQGKIPISATDVVDDGESHTIYAVDNSANAVVVVNTENMKIVARIPTSQNDTRNLAIDTSGLIAYATNVGSNTISVMDLRSATVQETIAVGNAPSDIAVDPGVHSVYVPTHGDGKVSIIDTLTRRVSDTLKTGGSPTGVAIDYATHHAFVSDGVKLVATLTASAPATPPNFPSDAATNALPGVFRDAATGCNPQTAAGMTGVACHLTVANPPLSSLTIKNNLEFVVADSQISDANAAKKNCTDMSYRADATASRVVCPINGGTAAFIYDLSAQALILVRAFHDEAEIFSFVEALGY